MFNDCIARLSLREIERTGANYTWTNKQVNPVRSVLDRVLVSAAWDLQFPLATLKAETRIGSDHTPLTLDTGDDQPPPRSNRFFFQTGWLQIPGFRDLVNKVWLELLMARVACQDPLDLWHYLSAGLRRYLKGWGANQGRDARVKKAQLLANIQELDRLADSAGLDEDGWAMRYHLEDQMIHLLNLEEEYWRQRGKRDWLLKGDANTNFFSCLCER